MSNVLLTIAWVSPASSRPIHVGSSHAPEAARHTSNSEDTIHVSKEHAPTPTRPEVARDPETGHYVATESISVVVTPAPRSPSTGSVLATSAPWETIPAFTATEPVRPRPSTPAVISTDTAVHGSSAGDMSPWALLMIIVIVLVAVLCAARFLVMAGRQIWTLPWSRTPRRFLRAVAFSLPSPGLMPILFFATFAGIASFVATRWVDTREARAPVEDSSVPRVASASTIPPEAPKFSATPEGRATFVQTMVPLLQRHGLTRDQAVLFTAHIARETGWGRWIYRNNFGNIKVPQGWTGESFWLTDARGFRDRYRAWSTPDEGIEANISLIRDVKRYRKAWSLLKAGSPHWYGQLGLDGYYEGPPDRSQKGHTDHNLATVSPVQRDYESIVALVRRYNEPRTGENQIALAQKNLDRW